VNINHKYTPIRVALPFILGVIVAVIIGTRYPPMNFIIPVIPAVIGLWINYRFFRAIYKYRWVTGVLACFILFCLGISMVSIINSKQPAQNTGLEADQDQLYLCQIGRAPVAKSKMYSGNARIVAFKDSNNLWVPLNSGIMLYFREDTLCKDLSYGDLIIMKGVLQDVPQPSNPYAFNFSKYLSNRQIYHQVFLEAGNWEKVGRHKADFLYVFAERSRKSLMNVFREFGIDGRDFGLVSALLLGNTEFLDAEIRQEFSYAGATHVLSVSGLHVAIVYVAADRLLFFLKRNRRGKNLHAVLTISFIWLYALITGLSTPVVRASLMFSLVAASNLLRRSSEGYNILAVSAFIQLWLNPYEITQVGFQLSYMAVLGIFAFYKPISEWIRSDNRVITWIWPVIAVSLAAQVTTSPLATYYFNMFPVYFLLTNLVVVPLSSLIIYFSVGLLAAGALNLTFQWLAWPLKWSLWLMMESVGEIQSWPGAVLESIVISPLQVLLLYGIIVMTFGFFMLKQHQWLIAGMASCLILLTTAAVQKYRWVSGNEIVVYSIPGHTAIDLLDGRNACFVADSALINNQQKMNFNIKPNRIQQGIKHVTELCESKDTVIEASGILMAYPFLSFQEKRIALINREWRYFNFPELMSVDLAVISGNLKPDPERLASQLKIKQVVIDSSVPFYRAEEWLSLFERAAIPCHSVRHEGAMVVRW